MSAFAEYVEQQQSIRYPSKAPAEASTSSAATATAGGGTGSAEHHEELQELFDNLELDESAPQVPLKDLLLGSDDDTLEKLQKLLAGRLEEGFGETVFELGYDYSGESLQLSLDEWNTARKRLDDAAQRIRANCQLLITKNVGGEEEAASTASNSGKDKSCSGKILIRQVPESIESVIETRIAVVGNGKPRHTGWSQVELY